VGILAGLAFEGELRMLRFGGSRGGVLGREEEGAFLCGESLFGGSLQIVSMNL